MISHSPGCTSCPELACRGRVTGVCPMGRDVVRTPASLTYQDLGPDAYELADLDPWEAGRLIERMSPRSIIAARRRLQRSQDVDP